MLPTSSRWVAMLAPRYKATGGTVPALEPKPSRSSCFRYYRDAQPEYSLNLHRIFATDTDNGIGLHWQGLQGGMAVSLRGAILAVVLSALVRTS